MANEFVSFEKLKIFLENIKTKTISPIVKTLSNRISALEQRGGGGGGTQINFVPRTNTSKAPEKGNKYWTNTAYGGLNPYQVESSEGSVLPNCVAYVYGRLLEINDQCHPETIWYPQLDGWKYYDTCKKNGIPVDPSIPKEGAIACWEDSTRSLGHVAIVESVSKDGNIYNINYTDSWSDHLEHSYYYGATSSDSDYYFSAGAWKFIGFVYAVELNETPIQDLATVAYTGEYSDLLNTPVIPSLDNYYTKSEINNETINTNNTSTSPSKHYKAPGSLTIGTRANNSFIGLRSASFGQNNEASGSSSHAEGDSVKASGSVSHAEGYGTIANSVMQHVEGRLNIEDSNDLWQHISGNGNGEDRNNSYTRDWNGNGYYAGDMYGNVTWNDDGTVNTKRKLAYADEILGQIIESHTINVSDWTSLPPAAEPFTYECTVIPQYDVGNDTIIELFMDSYQNTIFAKYGFSINYFNITTGKLYIQSIGLPDSSITFKVGFVG